MHMNQCHYHRIDWEIKETKSTNQSEAGYITLTTHVSWITEMSSCYILNAEMDLMMELEDTLISYSSRDILCVPRYIHTEYI